MQALSIKPADKWIKSDQRNFRVKKKQIEDALKGSTGIVSGVTEDSKADVFYMLLFCLCVPQSKAIKAEEAIDILRKKTYHSNDMTRAELLKILTGKVRFQSVKCDRLIKAKEKFWTTGFWDDLKGFFVEYQTSSSRLESLKIARDFLMSNVSGMGMKLASHFLRNIGMPGLVILDVHIIKGLVKRGLIEENSVKPLTSVRYEAVSEIFMEYANLVGISIDSLDMLLWSQQTGYVFK